MFTNTRSLHSLAPESVYVENQTLVSGDGTLFYINDPSPIATMGDSINEAGTNNTGAGQGV